MTDARDIVDQAKLDWAIVPRKIIDGEPFVHAELAGAWANQYADTLLTEIASLRKQLEDARSELAAIKAEETRSLNAQAADLSRHLKEQEEIREAGRWSSQ